MTVLETIGSTNTTLMQDPRPWRVLVADHQQQGRGRMARAWQAAPRSSIALSVTLPLPADPQCWGWVPLLVGLAACKGVAGVTGADLGLKWPNDLMARADATQPWRKLAGILCQTTTYARGPGHSAEPVVVAGIGLNIDLETDELPVETATSLKLVGAAPVAREQVVDAVLDALVAAHRAWCGGGDALAAQRTDYARHCVTVGQLVNVHLPGDRLHHGRAVRIDEAGRLVVQGVDGTVAHAVGDIVHVRPTEDR